MPDPSIHARFLVLICALLQAPGLAQAFPAELFNPPLNYAANANLRGIVATDLDDDGDLDIVVTSEYQDAVSVFLNDGGSAFAILASYPVGSDPWAVIASDFNGDSRLDLAVANNGSTYSNAADTISLLFGNGDGTFGPTTSYLLAANSSPRDLVAADLDGDGDLDLAVATHGLLGDHATDHYVAVLLNEGGGVFAGAIQYDLISIGNPNGTAAVRIFAHDLNGDGIQDLLTRNLGSDDLSVLLGNGDGTFSAATRYAYPGLLCVAMYGATFADFNGDGYLDAVVGCNWSSAGGSGILFVPGNGDGTFPGSFDPALVWYGMNIGNAPASLVRGDFDGDGNLDIVTANWNSSNISVLYGNGDGTFLQAGEEPSTGSYPSDIVAGDFNGDGLLDVSVVNFGYPSGIDLFLNSGPEPDPPPPPVPALSFTGAILFALCSAL